MANLQALWMEWERNHLSNSIDFSKMSEAEAFHFNFTQEQYEDNAINGQAVQQCYESERFALFQGTVSKCANLL